MVCTTSSGPCQPIPASAWVMIAPPTHSIAAVPTTISRPQEMRHPPHDCPAPPHGLGRCDPAGQVQPDVVGLHDQRDRPV